MPPTFLSKRAHEKFPKNSLLDTRVAVVDRSLVSDWIRLLRRMAHFEEVVRVSTVEVRTKVLNEKIIAFRLETKASCNGSLYVFS